jgi:hypothetical protein
VFEVILRAVAGSGISTGFMPIGISHQRRPSTTCVMNTYPRFVQQLCSDVLYNRFEKYQMFQKKLQKLLTFSSEPCILEAESFYNVLIL